MTKALYLDDAYLKEFDSNVTKVEGTSVWLDETAFYPTSGGQPHDTGIIKADKDYKVIEEKMVVLLRLKISVLLVKKEGRCVLQVIMINPQKC